MALYARRCGTVLDQPHMNGAYIKLFGC